MMMMMIIMTMMTTTTICTDLQFPVEEWNLTRKFIRRLCLCNSICSSCMRMRCNISASLGHAYGIFCSAIWEFKGSSAADQHSYIWFIPADAAPSWLLQLFCSRLPKWHRRLHVRQWGHRTTLCNYHWCTISIERRQETRLIILYSA